MGPPMNPLPWLTAKVSIFAIRMATTKPSPRVLHPWHRLELIAAREHRQRQGHADEPEHHAAEGRFGDARQLQPAEQPAPTRMNATSRVTRRAANRPRGMPASSCQSSKL